ncbi:hypothetical protein [Streptomyces sp. NBC_01443]|uniref:hypothetical protein n=1 Tax=Streptomyces sp. NBC_01443 TaxID=2903868 RepID=UPI0022518F98|nr:hypothetical protein [Streptomyces sp. NBC_01443]MCX4628274.1 hypothetical protein [Streptomyces sp. NBC_01443]
MDSFDQPVGQTVPSVDRTVLVPFAAIQDGTGLEWQLANSPYYTVNRKRSYSLALYGNNQGDTSQSRSKALTYGVSNTESQTFSSSVGVTVGFEAGVTGPLTFEAYSSVYYVSYDGSSSQGRREPVRAHVTSLPLPGT